MGCYAAWNGGLGSQADSSNIIIRRSHVEDNRAVHQGGVIQASANSSSEMVGCVVANNVAEYGAAISTQSCDQTLVAASTFFLGVGGALRGLTQLFLVCANCRQQVREQQGHRSRRRAVLSALRWHLCGQQVLHTVHIHWQLC